MAAKARKDRPSARTTIAVKGARVHNLRDVSVEIPRDQMIVITGLSGPGKSSLAFDTIYAEGQRRYLESLSSYAKRFVAQVSKPDVDFVFGLSPVRSFNDGSKYGFGRCRTSNRRSRSRGFPNLCPKLTIRTLNGVPSAVRLNSSMTKRRSV